MFEVKSRSAACSITSKKSWLLSIKRNRKGLSADGSHILKWWVDASFAVPPNLPGHSGGGLSMGRGFPIVGSYKQKINTQSSTESEIVGAADDSMPPVCWTRYFIMEAQGYKIVDNLMYQDNKSSILLEKNGKALSSKRTKHIYVRCFSITDRIQQDKLSVVWCPTGNMIGDYTRQSHYKVQCSRNLGIILWEWSRLETRNPPN